MTQRVDLDRIETLLASAKPGPWTITRYEHGGGRIDTGTCLIADLYDEPEREYIVALLTDAPELIAELRALRVAADPELLALRAVLVAGASIAEIKYALAYADLNDPQWRTKVGE